MSVESVTLSNHLILCPSFLLLPSIFSIIKVFSNVWSWFEVHLCWILHAIAVFLDSLFFLIDLPDYAYANITLIMEALDWHIYTIVYEIVSGKLLNNTGSPAHALWWPRGVGLGEGKEGREGRDIYVSSLTHPPPPLRPALFRLKCLGGRAEATVTCAVPRSARVPVFLKYRKCIKERKEFNRSQRSPVFAFFPSFPPPPPPKHRLLIFKSTAIAWCGFKSWGAILPDDDCWRQWHSYRA